MSVFTKIGSLFVDSNTAAQVTAEQETIKAFTYTPKVHNVQGSYTPKVHNVQGSKTSGARFRELILAGKSNAECVQIVRAEFPNSIATNSDASWNRNQLKRFKMGLPVKFKVN